MERTELQQHGILRTALAISVGLFALALSAQDGLLDPSFSGDGKVVYDNGGREEEGVGIAVRPDGKIWAIGNSYDGVGAAESILLLRFNSDGTPDNSFDTDGVKEFSAGTGYTFSSCLVLQADGTLLIGGYFIDDLGYTHPIVFKVDANGNSVPGFGTGGLAMQGTLGDGYRITDLGVQSDGGIVYTAARTAEILPLSGGLSGSGVFADPTQYFMCSINNRFNALTVLDNDHVLITGMHGYDSTSTNFKTFILALNPDLTGDTDFSPGYICGQFTNPTEGIEYYDSNNPQVFANDVGNDIAQLPSGDILICGSSIDTANNADVYRTMLLRVHVNNDVDESFGYHGFIKSFVGSFYRHMVAQANGNVLAVGGNFDGELVLARFSTDGELDAGFGNNNGFTNTAVGSFSTSPGNMAVQADGRILVVGTAVNNNDDVVILRYNGSPVGIAEGSAIAGGLQVFPNPATDKLHVSGAMLRDWSIMNADGRTMGSGNDPAVIDLQGLADGLYVLRARTEHGTVFERFVVER